MYSENFSIRIQARLKGILKKNLKKLGMHQNSTVLIRSAYFTYFSMDSCIYFRIVSARQLHANCHDVICTSLQQQLQQ